MAAHIQKKTIRSSAPSSSTPFTFARFSKPHEAHPERNEDTLLVDQRRGLAAVFDGVGYGPGQIASRLAARVIRRGWERALAPLQSAPDLLTTATTLDLPATLQQLLEDANQQVRTRGVQQAKNTHQLSEDTDRYPATTVALVIFSRNITSDDTNNASGYTMTYAHVGDSRIYLLRNRETFTRLTEDDGYFSLLLDKGTITEDDVLRIDQATSADELSEAERGYFARRNGITQALGEATLSIHIARTTISPGDRVLLCTDGIHDNLTDQELATLLKQSPRTTAARKLVQQAITFSQQDSSQAIRSKKDDMSAIVITCLPA